MLDLPTITELGNEFKWMSKMQEIKYSYLIPISYLDISCQVVNSIINYLSMADFIQVKNIPVIVQVLNMFLMFLIYTSLAILSFLAIQCIYRKQNFGL